MWISFIVTCDHCPILLLCTSQESLSQSLLLLPFWYWQTAIRSLQHLLSSPGRRYPAHAPCQYISDFPASRQPQWPCCNFWEFIWMSSHPYSVLTTLSNVVLCVNLHTVHFVDQDDKIYLDQYWLIRNIFSGSYSPVRLPLPCGASNP